MPPPGKRPKMSQSETSDMTMNSSSMFSEPARLDIRAKTGSKCLACMSMPVEATHVIAVNDRSVPLLVSSGLISYDLRSSSNRVALCPTCHTMFDQADDPGFIFFPVDIAFFIRAELEDRKRRKMEGGGRVVPSADEYKRYQAEQGHVPATAEGGLYFRCFLQEYLHVGTGFSARQMFEDPVVYHGAPFGAFRRAFRVLGSPRSNAMSFAVTQQLFLLKNLYFMEEDVEVLGLKDDDVNPPILQGPYAPHFNLPPSFGNNSRRSAAPAMPYQSTAMGPSQYTGQMIFAATNDHSNYDTICCLKEEEGDAGKDLKQDHDNDHSHERDHGCEHNRNHGWDSCQSLKNGYSQHLQVSPKSQPALMQVKPTLTLTPTLTSKSAPSLITPHILVPPTTKSEHRGHSSIDSFSIDQPPFEDDVVLGPELTTNDIIERYRPVIESSTLVL